MFHLVHVVCHSLRSHLYFLPILVSSYIRVTVKRCFSERPGNGVRTVKDLCNLLINRFHSFINTSHSFIDASYSVINAGHAIVDHNHLIYDLPHTRITLYVSFRTCVVAIRVSSCVSLSSLFRAPSKSTLPPLAS